MASPAADGPPPPPENGLGPDQHDNPFVLTPEQFALLPHDDAGPKLNAIIWTLTGLSGVFLALRIYCRVSRRTRLWWDDTILIASWICITVESALLTRATTLGYGLHIWDFDVINNMAPLVVLVNTAGSLSVTAAIWSKTSFGITLLPLTKGWVKYGTWFILVSMNVAMGLSALFPWVSCKPLHKAWDPWVEGECWDPKITVHYNIFSGVYSSCADIALALLPWQFILGLHMRQREKIGVGIAMSMGVFAGITGFVKVSKIPNMLSEDFADGVDLWIWGNAETSVTIIAASIPMLRVMIRDATGSRRGYGTSTDYYAKDSSGPQLSTRRHTGMRVVTVSSGPMASDIEMVKPGSNDDDSDRGILADDHHADAVKMNRIVQTRDFQIQYDKRPGEASD